MVEDPPAKRQQTEELVQSRLADHKNLVLCVEEASCSSLDSIQAVGRVRAQGRASQTIMVLIKLSGRLGGSIRHFAAALAKCVEVIWRAFPQGLCRLH